MGSLAWMATSDYDVGRMVIQRGVALAYLLAFANVIDQFVPLLGTHGLQPVPRFLARSTTTFRRAPSLFRVRYSDRLARTVGWFGAALSVSALVGAFDAVPVAVALAAWGTLWFLYASVVNVGQRFYGFGWESLLLEAGLTVALLGNARVATPIITLFCLRWLLFRVEFGAGMIKMRGDPCWRDLTCLRYHHETQPMPGPTSRAFHLLPAWVHRVETAANHAVQLVAPWLLFAPQPVAGVGAAAIIVTQAYLMCSGNYAWLNLVTLVLGFAAIPDGWFAAVGLSVGHQPATTRWFDVAVVAFAALVVALSRPAVRNLVARDQRMNAAHNPLRIAGSYGAFGSVTRRRREVIVEGSLDGRTWQAYECRAKPGDPGRRPPQIAPYHLRLDWLLWFVSLSPSYGRGWFDRFLDRLLDGDPGIRRLLRRDPFDGVAPEMVRVRLVDYRFSTRPERRAGASVWIPGRSETLVPPRRLRR